MMEVEYRREMNRNYMVIRPETAGNEKYTMRMLSGNRIQGLLPFQDKMVNGEVRYYYDITSKQPLNRVLEHRNIAGKELRTFMTELLFALRQMERFLLDEGQILFQPEYIYVDPGTFQASFCLVPGMHKDFAAELCELSQYLLDHVNQSDGDAVVLAFSIFKECRKLNFGMEDIEQCLRRQTRECEEEVKKKKRADGENKEKESWELRDTKTDEAARSISPANTNRKEDPESKRKGIGENREGKIAGIVICMLLFPLGLFVWRGMRGLYQFKWVLAGVEILLLAGGFVVWSCLANEREEKNSERAVQSGFFGWESYPDEAEKKELFGSPYADEEPWEVYFLDEEEQTVSSGQAKPRVGIASEVDTVWKEEKEDDDGIETVLLSARPIYKECRKLVSVSDGTEVPIGYFPFLIGKSRDLSDHVLNKPGVSRLHVKLEETESGYFVTDLNSTNGTVVNGRLLEANETCAIAPGDELVIAAERFYFR